MPNGEPLEEEHLGVARPERERKARQPREVEHELRRELHVVRVSELRLGEAERARQNAEVVGLGALSISRLERRSRAISGRPIVEPEQ